MAMPQMNYLRWTASRIFPIPLINLGLVILIASLGAVLWRFSPESAPIFLLVFFGALALAPLNAMIESGRPLSPMTNAHRSKQDKIATKANEDSGRQTPEAAGSARQELVRFLGHISPKTLPAIRTCGPLGPAISIVIPAFNVEKSIPETLTSLCDQSSTRFNVIVVDDGSTDGTVDVVRSFEDRFGNRLRLLQQGNVGLSGARNSGLEQVDTEYVAFLDADDRYLPHFIGDAVSDLDATGADAAIYRMMDFRPEVRRYQEAVHSLRISQKREVIQSPSASDVLKLTNPQVSNKVFALELINRSGILFPLDRTIIDDLPTVYPWLAAAKRVAVSNAIHFLYRRKEHGLHEEYARESTILLRSLDLLHKRIAESNPPLEAGCWDAFVLGKLEWGTRVGGVAFARHLSEVWQSGQWEKQLEIQGVERLRQLVDGYR